MGASTGSIGLHRPAHGRLGRLRLGGHQGVFERGALRHFERDRPRLLEVDLGLRVLAVFLAEEDGGALEL